MPCFDTFAVLPNVMFCHLTLFDRDQWLNIQKYCSQAPTLLSLCIAEQVLTPPLRSQTGFGILLALRPSRMVARCPRRWFQLLSSSVIMTRVLNNHIRREP